MDLEDVVWGNGNDNDGGLASVAYYARKSDFTTIQWLPASPADFSEKQVIAGDHVFKAGGFCFRQIGVTLEKGQLVSTMVGERNSHSFENVVTLGQPGNKAEALALLEEIKNDDLIMLVKELDGQVRQLGWTDVPAHIDSGETTTGMKVADFKGTSLVVKSIGRVAPIYEGEILLTPTAP